MKESHLNITLGRYYDGNSYYFDKLEIIGVNFIIIHTCIYGNWYIVDVLCNEHEDE